MEESMWNIASGIVRFDKTFEGIRKKSTTEIPREISWPISKWNFEKQPKEKLI